VSISKEELESINERFKGDKSTEMFAAGLLTFNKYNASSRLLMHSAHEEQRLILKNPEFPRIYTGFENAYGKRANSITKSNNNYRVIDVISKFSVAPRHIYIYVVQDVMTGVYDVIEINHYEKYSGTHGYVKPMTSGDKYVTGQIIPANRILAHAPSHDKDGNYCAGINAKVAYMSLAETEEDSYVISESFSKRVQFYQIEETIIILNNNIILTNYYGDLENYKSFPDIGEDVKNNILCVKRQLNFGYAASELTTQSLLHVFDADKIVKGDGKVIDIDIFINNEDEFENNINRTQISDYWNASKLYHTHIVNTLGNIVKNKQNSYTYRLKMLYERSQDFLNPDIKFTSSNGLFEFGLIIIKTCYEVNLFDGNKIVDRHGSKGVDCYVFPDDEMPRDKWGNIADIIQSPPGIIARENFAQSYEHELNFCSDQIRRLMVDYTKQGVDKQFAILRDYLAMVDEKQTAELDLMYSSCSEVDKKEFIADIILNGIYIRQPPFEGAITIEQLARIYDKYNIEPSRVRMKRKFRRHGDISDYKEIENKQLFGLDIDFYKNNDIFTTPHNINDDVAYKDEDFVFKNHFTVPSTNKGDYTSVKSDKDGNFTAEHTVRSNNSIFNLIEEKWEEETYVEDHGDFVYRSFLTNRPVIIAEKYYIVLKHLSSQKISARYLSSTSPLGLPNKSSSDAGSSGTGTGSIKTTPLKLGEMENLIMRIRLSDQAVQYFQSSLSKNPTIRAKIFEMLLYEDPLELHDVILDEKDGDDISPQVFGAYLQCLGYEIVENEDFDIYTPFDGLNLTADQILSVVQKHHDLKKLI
jgi:hypothetical protein